MCATINKEVLEFVSDHGLMIARHPDGTWMVFRALAFGWSEGNSPSDAVQNWKKGIKVSIPEHKGPGPVAL